MANGPVLYEGPGFAVPEDFGCWHDTGYVRNWPKMGGQDMYYGPDPNFKIRGNRVRLYGMNGIEWNNTETAPGVFNWAVWDEAIGKLRSTGVRHLTLNVFNPPQFANRHPHEYGRWQMQLPLDRAMLERWLTAVTSRYPEIDVIETANEVFAPAITDGSFKGTVAELTQLADWTLDWRIRTGWRGKIWAPSIPGYAGNVPPILNWLRQYPRSKEFDGFPLHLYDLMPDFVGQRQGPATSWTSLVEFREGLAAMGLGPVVDSEKGFPQGAVVPGVIYNYAVASLLQGVRVTCYFFLGSYGTDGTSIGDPYRNAWAKQDLEAVADLAGKTITRVVKTPSGRWSVTTAPQP